MTEFLIVSIVALAIMGCLALLGILMSVGIKNETTTED